MRNSLLVFAMFFSLVAIPARADRPVTEAEAAKLAPALAAEDCSGGEMEFDDGEFEVEGATCKDGKTYELKFDTEFRLIKKKLQN